MLSIHTILKKSQLRWAGQVTRMPDYRLPQKILYGELKTDNCLHGGQKKRFKDTIKVSLKCFSIDMDSWESLAQDRLTWRSLIQDGAASSESHRITKAE